MELKLAEAKSIGAAESRSERMRADCAARGGKSKIPASLLYGVAIENIFVSEVERF